MRKLSKRQILDISLYAAICIWAIISIITMIVSAYVIQWQHYLGLFFLAINGYVFYRTHQGGTLFTGLTLLLALFGILSFNVGLLGSSVTWTPFDLQIRLFWGNPVILLLLVVHFILSGRHYAGILTKQYWETFRKTLKQ